MMDPRATEDRPTLSPGSSWIYRAPAGFETSRIIIGAIVRFPEHEPVVCCAVTEAPRRRPDGTVDRVTIPFLPMTEAALMASVVQCDGEAQLPDGFLAGLDEWQGDGRGLSAFTVPFEGLLDRMIALQMAEIAGRPGQ